MRSERREGGKATGRVLRFGVGVIAAVVLVWSFLSVGRGVYFRGTGGVYFREGMAARSRRDHFVYTICVVGKERPREPGV